MEFAQMLYKENNNIGKTKRNEIFLTPFSHLGWLRRTFFAAFSEIYHINPIFTMNNERRALLAEARDALDEVIDQLNDIKDEEQETYDNLPENFQDTDRGQKMNDAIEQIDQAISSIEEAQQAIDEASNKKAGQ
ncbi:hypothetical protein [Alistipes sp. i18-0019-D1]|uniref:hypothetical protein n=1 Tax=Alistipes sp. i18-0019-D1 TaxID=3132707 RepID=UPI0036F438E5